LNTDEGYETEDEYGGSSIGSISHREEYSNKDDDDDIDKRSVDE
jgi:hypothetical protein